MKKTEYKIVREESSGVTEWIIGSGILRQWILENRILPTDKIFNSTSRKWVSTEDVISNVQKSKAVGGKYICSQCFQEFQKKDKYCPRCLIKLEKKGTKFEVKHKKHKILWNGMKIWKIIVMWIWIVLAGTMLIMKNISGALGVSLVFFGIIFPYREPDKAFEIFKNFK